MKNAFIVLLAGGMLACAKEKTRIPVHVAEQEDVLTEAGIDEALAQFKEVSYKDLSTAYVEYSHPNCKFDSELRNRDYYLIMGTQVDKKVIGDYTVRDFLCHDDYYNAYKDVPCAEFEQYWLVDKKVLYMMLELIHGLDELGHNKYGFHIRNSHRHPTLNTKSNGASYSQHMFGKAIDIGIDDINNDGESTQDDKTIVYDLLEDIVGNRGGLGKYPGSMNLHFDCRGFRARWDVP